MSGLKPLEIPFRNYQPAVVYIFSVIKITKLFILGKPLISKTGFEITYRGDSASPLKRDMAEEITTIQFILTRDEAEALLLEEELIKTYQPHYNIRMKDDKSYPYIHFDARGDFPAVKIARRKTAKPGYFYGPYTNSKKSS